MIFREKKIKNASSYRVGFEESGKKRKKKIERNNFCVGYLRPMFFSVSLFYANRVIPRANVEKKKNSIQV